MGAFSLKISIAPSGETIARIKNKLRVATMVRSSSNTMPSIVEIVGRAPVADEKMWCFFLSFCLSRFGITKFVITETLWSSNIFKRIMVSLHGGRFVVVYLYLTFSVDPHNFPLGANVYQKIAIFRDFGDCKPTFLKPQRWNLAHVCRPVTSSPKQNFVKIA